MVALDIDEVDVGGGGDAVSSAEAAIGGSERSKFRAKNILNSLLNQHEDVAQVDVLRKVIYKLTQMGEIVVGVQVEKSRKSASKLSDRQVRHIVEEKVMKERRLAKSFEFWLPLLIAERMKWLQTELGRYGLF